MMGRAIDMENDIALIKMQVEKLQNQLRGMVSRIDSIDNKKEKNGKKKSNDEGNAKSSKQSSSKSV